MNLSRVWLSVSMSIGSYNFSFFGLPGLLFFLELLNSGFVYIISRRVSINIVFGLLLLIFGIPILTFFIISIILSGSFGSFALLFLFCSFISFMISSVFRRMSSLYSDIFRSTCRTYS